MIHNSKMTNETEYVSIEIHTTYTVRNKWEKLEHIGEAIFNIPFMI